ncbi:hypothetical protein [Schleiferilactobacillus harbinensis]|jgi:hypothetical protein|nr:hypothetical protein [Schleiferilactobacillus harbinensis]MCI1686654.1 hypothetical protein [Schleiferilactobacillus harbinensis]MCI1784195.1 hypothetical protein [Schleiferilactobacillus harbinensis]MCI1849384.1 hypothetical protein [Schleiferilactobacillus harbinensis]
MKIYNPKRFWSGIFFAVMTTLLITLMILDWTRPNGRPLNSLVIIVLSLLFAIVNIRLGFSPDSKKQDAIEAQDERNRVINERSRAQTTRIMLGVLITVSVLGGISYIFIRTAVILTIFALATALTNLYFYVWIGTTVYYNRKL